MTATFIITTETNDAEDLKLALSVILAGVRDCEGMMEPGTVMVRALPDNGGLEFKFTTTDRDEIRHDKVVA